MARMAHTCTHTGCDCVHKKYIRASQPKSRHRWGISAWNLTYSWGAMGWLLGKGESRDLWQAAVRVPVDCPAATDVLTTLFQMSVSWWWEIQTSWTGENGKRIWAKHTRSMYEILKQHILKVEKYNKLNFVLGKIPLCWMLPCAFNLNDWKQGQADHRGSLGSQSRQNTEILV